jgi:hypothetical protein
MVILRNLGHINWVVKLDNEELGVKPVCEVCGSKGHRHKKGCSLAK